MFYFSNQKWLSQTTSVLWDIELLSQLCQTAMLAQALLRITHKLAWLCSSKIFFKQPVGLILPTCPSFPNRNNEVYGFCEFSNQ